MSRQAVGVTGKLWRKVSMEERDAYQCMAEDGFSFRDIGLKFGRDHNTVSYNLKKDKDRLIASEKSRERRIAKKQKPISHVQLMKKLRSCIFQARRRAENKGLPININTEFLAELYKAQQGFCALTGIKMEIYPIPGCRVNPYAISVDRIDSKIGYIRDNVRLVIWCINWALGEWGEHHFEEIVKTYLFKKYGSQWGNEVS